MIPQAKIDKFWSRVDKSGECWVWTRYVNIFGYGQVSGFGKGLGTAHRVSYFLKHGPIPTGAHICHSCNVARCCNDAHLYAGNPLTNSWDRVLAGRSNYSAGAKERDRSKLPRSDAARASAETCRALRMRCGMTQREVAAALGCSTANVSNNEQAWRVAPADELAKLERLADAVRRGVVRPRYALPAGEHPHSLDT